MDYFEKNLYKLMPKKFQSKDEGDLEILLQGIGKELDSIKTDIDEVASLHDVEKMDEYRLRQMESMLNFTTMANKLTITERRELVKHGIRLYKLKGSELAVRYITHVILNPQEVYVEKVYNYSPTGNFWVDERIEDFREVAELRPDYTSTVAVIPYIRLYGGEDMKHIQTKYEELTRELIKYVPLETNLIMEITLEHIQQIYLELRITHYTFGVTYKICNMFRTDDKEGKIFKDRIELGLFPYHFDTNYPITNIHRTDDVEGGHIPVITEWISRGYEIHANLLRCNQFSTARIRINSYEGEIISDNDYRTNEILFKRVGDTSIGEGDI